MELLKKAELKLAELYKSAPKLSASSQDTVVKIWPWLALIGGALQLLSALNLFRWARVANEVNDAFNEFYRSIGADSVVASSRWSFWVWAALIFAVVQGVLLLLAFPKLRELKKSGWDLLFIVGLMNILYAIVSLFIGGGYGFGGAGSLIWNLIVTAVVFWLLFAVRDKYKGAGFNQPEAKKDPEAPADKE